MHDLIREHARTLASRLDPGNDRDQATTRLLDYYQHTAARADALITRQARPPPAAATGEIPDAAPALADLEQALAWVRAERASLLACLDHATRTGQDAGVIAFTIGIAGLLRRDGPRADAITRHTAAIEAARHLGDRLGQANALHDLGDVQWLTGDYRAASQALEQALGIYRDLGNQLGCHRKALELARATASSPDEARALAGLGRCALAAGQDAQARILLRQALETFQQIGTAEAPRLLAELGALTGPQPAP